MFLADHHIEKGVKEGRIVIEPFEAKRLQPASYDILLGNTFWTTSSGDSLAIDPVKKTFPRLVERHIEDGEEYYLHPGITVLGISKDFFGSDEYLVHLSGKSSLARLGLVVHNTAGLINPGHFLNITFELCNFSKLPFILRPGMPIAQILFSEISAPPRQNYRQTGRYTSKNTNHFAAAKKKAVKKAAAKKATKKKR